MLLQSPTKTHTRFEGRDFLLIAGVQTPGSLVVLHSVRH